MKKFVLKHRKLIAGACTCLAICFVCDIYYWIIDTMEGWIPMLENWGMEG